MVKKKIIAQLFQEGEERQQITLLFLVLLG